MGYVEFAEHTEVYTINGRDVAVTANFINNLLMIRAGNDFRKLSLLEYEEFDGDMREFVTHKLED